MSPSLDLPRTGDRRALPIVLFVGASLVALVLLVSLFLYRWTIVEAASMLPTLRKGDLLIWSKIPYGLSRFSFPIDIGFRGRMLGHAPRRGDIAVFALPRNPRITYVKRVVGLPGDRVQMREGRLVLNGVTVRRDAVAKVAVEIYDGTAATVPTYRETLPDGTAYTIVEAQGDHGFNDNTAEMTVPPGAFFVLGDNRDNSLDSRVASNEGGVGTVPLDNFIGRVEHILPVARDAGRTSP